MSRFLAVGFGGFLGAVGRFALNKWVQTATGARFPYGTLVVNVLGSFLLAFLTVRLARSELVVSLEWRLFILTGILGAFTTFSTFSHESIVLLRDGFVLGFVGNVLSNVIVCLLGVIGGMLLGGEPFF